jgi:hypothetical protein
MGIKKAKSLKMKLYKKSMLLKVQKRGDKERKGVKEIYLN